MIWLEGLSYLVTILGFPAAIFVIVREERLRRANEVSELHRSLSQEYDGFLRMVMDNSDLLLMSQSQLPEPVSQEQCERIEIIYRMLLSLFEKAFIILHSDEMDTEARRRWSSWEDDIIEWCQRDHFRQLLPKLVEGEDPQFRAYILQLGQEAEGSAMT
ncbi:hypothetical protein [uncultured Roseobacter sp.]|nr:hypothetical protein [uncultured Roseobacter sp.]